MGHCCPVAGFGTGNNCFRNGYNGIGAADRTFAQAYDFK